MILLDEVNSTLTGNVNTVYQYLFKKKPIEIPALTCNKQGLISLVFFTRLEI